MSLSARQRRRIQKDVARRIVDNEIKRIKLDEDARECIRETESHIAEHTGQSRHMDTDLIHSGSEYTATTVSSHDEESDMISSSLENTDEELCQTTSYTEDNIIEPTADTAAVCSIVSNEEDLDIMDSSSYCSDSTIESDVWDSNDDDQSDEDVLLEEERELLFSGASTSTHAFSVALLSIFHKHSLTYACVTDILKLIGQALPSPNYLPQTQYTIMRKFVDYNDDTLVHHCCGFCTRLLPLGSDCLQDECLASGVQKSTFIEVRLNKQLQHLFSDENFVKLLQYRFEREHDLCNICDIYDGQIYKEKSPFFASPYNISFTLNYDGAPKFKSSNMQIWPIQLWINELPPLVRKTKNYMLLAGLWCSTQKPPSFTFLEPFLACMKDMEEKGYKIHIAGRGQQLVKAQLICAVMDLPAKAAILNCNQYNGQYGCSTCKHSGSMVTVGRGKTRVYAYQQDVKMREHQDHCRDAQKALDGHKTVCGVKGYSPLHMIPSFDIIQCIPVDYMHCVLLGVAKKLAKLWFDSAYSKEEWYIGRKASDVDKRLLQINLPDTVSRAPRSITQRKYWKASEWKSFLFYFIPATLSEILPDKFYVHVFLLIKSIRILLANRISDEKLHLAEKLIKRFCQLQEQYYGLANCGINIHLLSHFTHYVRMFGPLWTHSAFAFEGQMHNFLRQSHATHGIGKQIVTSYLLNQSLHIERQRLLDSPTCQVVMKSFLAEFQRTPQCSTSIVMVGKGVSFTLEDKQIDELNQLLTNYNLLPLSSPHVRIYDKAVIRGKVFFTKENKRVKRRNSYTIAFSVPFSNSFSYGIVEKFLKINDHCLAIVTELTIQCAGPPRGIILGTITDESRGILFEDYLTYKEGNKKIIFMHQILEKSFNLTNEDWKLLCLPVNDVEFE